MTNAGSRRIMATLNHGPTRCLPPITMETAWLSIPLVAIPTRGPKVVRHCAPPIGGIRLVSDTKTPMPMPWRIEPCVGMEQISKQAGHSDDQARYQAAADKLKAAYFKTFYNPATGVLAGWRSSRRAASRLLFSLGQRHCHSLWSRAAR